jgi:tryptophan synthase alpha chain
MLALMKRIFERFQSLRQYDRTALIAYLTAGYPDLQTTVATMHACAEAGCDLIEVGVPFSDPMADGPAIEKAMVRSLAGGTTLQSVMDCVSLFRKTDRTTPVVLFGYANPFYQYGYDRLAKEAKRVGVDGFLVVDLPPEEADELVQLESYNGLDFIGLFTPTSSDARTRTIAQRATGFAYYVSMAGVTGGGISGLETIAKRVASVRTSTQLPVAVGFGIRTGEDARAVSKFADGVVIGSELIRRMEKAGSAEAPAAAGAFIADIRAALDRAS